MIKPFVPLVCLLFASLAACSRHDESAPEAQPASAPSTPASTPPPPATTQALFQALRPEVAARLVRPHSPVLGAANARVTVVEVLDPACEACRAFAPVVEQLLFLYPKDVRVVVRFADFHPPSLDAIRLLEAAHRQGKFREMLDALFERQEEWASHGAPDPARVWKIAGDIGLDVTRAQKDALAPSVDGLLRLEAEDLVELKVERTPTFFVNGKLLADFGSEQLFQLVKDEVGGAP